MLTPSAWSSTSTSTHFHASHFCLLAEGEVAHLLVSKSPLAEEQIQSTLVACDASLLLAFNVFDCPIPTPLNLQPVLVRAGEEKHILIMRSFFIVAEIGLHFTRLLKMVICQFVS